MNETRSPHILVVEDEAIVSMQIAKALQRWGYSTCAAESGEDAIKLAKKENPDLALMDIMLAGPMDGIQTAAYLTRHHRTPIVYLTANADESTVNRAKLTEPYGYILKPFQDARLRNTIDLAVQRYTAAKRIKQGTDVLLPALETIEDAVFTSDAGGRLIYTNMAGETLMGRSLDQARGTPLAELFSGLVESQWSILQDAVQKAVQTGIGADLSTQNIIIPAANGVPARRAQGVAPMGPSKEDITGAVLIFRGVGQSDPAAQGSCAQHSSVGNLSPLEEKGRDELTGLLSRADAENALRSAIEHATHRFLAAFVLDRFDPIRHRFGIRAAQEVLLFYSIHLAQSMGPTDLLFHWSGPSFLMLLDRSAPATEVRREISAWAGVRLEKVVEATAHQAMLLISGKWRLFEALESVSPPRLIDEVDAFATGGQ